MVLLYDACAHYRSSPYNADDRAGINVQLDMLKPIPADSDSFDAGGAEETSGGAEETSYLHDKIVMKVCGT